MTAPVTADEKAAYEDLVAQGYRQIEAECSECHDVFNPNDSDDLDHINIDTGEVCGPGWVLGGWK